MTIFATCIFVLYLCCLLVISLFCLSQLYLTCLYLLKRREKSDHQPPPSNHGKLPFVTIQLPVYNEKLVIERLIDRVCEIEYPREQLEIQVLDDSGDETVQKASRKVAEKHAEGINITHVCRDERTGFKAGALDAGLQMARGEFIAIFDADFLPRKDFLQLTTPHFADPEIGVVQTRWGHLNEGYSLLTQLQAFFLNAHFSIEQTARQAGGYFLQFNGTGGIWRKSCIVDAGGWQPDTLTEDLDLSYRAQLRGWKVRYLESVDSPAELPIDLAGLKSQQFRWMKGGAETARKLFSRIWHSQATTGKKWQAFSHLFASSLFPFIFLLAVISVPFAFTYQYLSIHLGWLAFFFIALLGISGFYFVGNVIPDWRKGSKLKSIVHFVLLYPIFISLSMGLSLHNTIAVIQGLAGRKSAFIRTPKYNVIDNKPASDIQAYKSRKLPRYTLPEGLCFLYFSGAIVLGVIAGKPAFLVFHSLLALGFGGIFLYSLSAIAKRSKN